MTTLGTVSKMKFGTDMIANLNYVMGETRCELTVLDVAETLQQRYAFISGGRSRDGCPIMSLPDNPHNSEVTEQQYQDVVTYLCSIPSLRDIDLGFVVVIDRRNDKWSSVKTILLRISTFFPALIQVAYIVKPAGFFQKHISDIGYKSVKEDCKFEVIMCNNVQELYSHIDRDQLTQDLGGLIAYDHAEWIQQRAAIEKFSANTHHVSGQLQQCTERLSETELPNDVAGTEALLRDHGLERMEVKEELKSVVEHGETLLSCIREPELESGQAEMVLSVSKVVHVTAVERLLVQLEETEKAFDKFWDQHHKKLQQCMQLRKFEDEFRQLQYVVERHLEKLKEEALETENSLLKIENHITDMKDFEENTKNDIHRAEQLRMEGEALIEDQHYAVDSIRPKCLELQRICLQYKEVVRQRNELLRKKRDLYDRLEKANKWCTRGVDLLAMQDMTPDGVDVAIKEISGYLQLSKQLNLNNPREFRQTFESVLTPEIKNAVQEGLKRIEDIQDMCKKRLENLKKVKVNSRSPPQQLTPPEKKEAVPLRSSVSTEDLHHKRKRNGEIKKNGGTHLRTKIELVRQDGNESSSSLESESESLHRGQQSGGVNKTTPPVSPLADLDTLHAKRGHVMKELIETERIYVKELKSIIDGYAKLMDDPEMQHLIPAHIKGKKREIFGNIEDIYTFHHDEFLKDLENCQNTPSLVGRCFVDRREEFQMYSYYCQNKPRSEALRQEAGDHNSFFKECQRRLDHKLPLGAYLLKPVQRITKYQLLLREMLKYTGNDIGSVEIKDALDAMLGVVKYVNDIMHQIAITGYKGNLSDLGKLLMQGSFSMWTEHKQKKDKLKDLRFKPMQRHVFLYEKLIMFCKRKDHDTHADKHSYIYKSSLQTAQVGLTENVKGDKRKFEVWLHGRSEVYIIQAPTEEVKKAWVVEVKKVLLSQFDQIKERRQRILSSKPSEVHEEAQNMNRKNSDNYPPCNNNSLLVTPSSTSSADHSPTSDGQSPDYEQYTDDEDWSSNEFTDTDEETSEATTPSAVVELPVYVALGDYQGADNTELSLHEGEEVTVVTIGDSGWWFVKSIETECQGWTPSTYLEPISRRSSRSAISMTSLESGLGSNGIHHAVSKNSIGSSTSGGCGTSMEGGGAGGRVKSHQNLLDQLEDTVV